MSLATTIQRQVAQSAGKLGVPIMITRTETGAGFPDPVTGEAPATVKATPAKAIVSPASGGTIQAFDTRFEGGTLIESNLRALLVFAYKLGFAPKPGDVVTELEDSTWTVLGVTPESLQGVVIDYKLTVKR